VRAAERTLAADTAKIGQAEAARFPRLSFMGIIGIGGATSRPKDHWWQSVTAASLATGSSTTHRAYHRDPGDSSSLAEGRPW
jgi:outer membrane protein TolC